MAESLSSRNSTPPLFDGIEITSDTLTGRGGLALFSRYLRNLEIFPHIDRLFGSMRKSSKGLPVTVLFHQLFCFFLDGTSRHLVRFDELKQDEGYAAVIETQPDQMASSHTIKRFFGAFWWPRIWLFRRLLLHLFVWRLKLEAPPVVVLGIDAMVMDNDEANVRHGVQPTYKKVKGFAPLQMTWGRFLIDAVFRGGKKHSNSGNSVEQMVRHVVTLIRKHYRGDVPIVLRLDSGFFDQKLFDLFEELRIGYICVGKLYPDIKAFAAQVPACVWSEYKRPDKVWCYLEFGDRRGRWKKGRRALLTRPLAEDGQWLLEFARPDTLLYTNLGMGEDIDMLLQAAGLGHWIEPEHVIRLHHSRGGDELVHPGRSRSSAARHFPSNASQPTRRSTTPWPWPSSSTRASRRTSPSPWFPSRPMPRSYVDGPSISRPRSSAPEAAGSSRSHAPLGTNSRSPSSGN